jgi:phosphoenolpyruvate carboxykinase (GTP)
MRSVSTTALLHDAPTTNQGLIEWVNEWESILLPDNVRWCDGSDAEFDELSEQLVEAGTFKRLNPQTRPNSFLACSDPADVARVEERTFICSHAESDAGPTNNWRDPAQMKAEVLPRLSGSMIGRTMFVIPFSMGPIGSPLSQIGVQLTDSAYVAVSMQLMTRMGADVLDVLGDDEWVRCIHSVGRPLVDGQPDVAWPCDPDQVAVTHYPESREIWSYGSGYGGNALLGKKCFALRIASVMARDDGWLAEHMMIIGVTAPSGEKRFIAAALPSQCGKTNLAMMLPTLPGWTVETVGDDIAWMHIGDDGQMYAINPEAGFFGVAPGTSTRSNPTAVATLTDRVIYTNVASTPDGDVWWEGLTDEPPEGLIDWQGNTWDPDAGVPAAHPNSRFTVRAQQCPTISSEWEDPAGVPISAILFGGRRATAVPLVTEATSWAQGVFLASIMSSEKTAAAAGTVGDVRFDPFAMLPFCGYHMADYFGHWLDMGDGANVQLPKLFLVNWFRRSDDGSFLWPGFGDNSRVIKWIFERLDGTGGGVKTPIGTVPTIDAIDRSGLDGAVSDSAMTQLLEFDPEVWAHEVTLIAAHYDRFGGRLPLDLALELRTLHDGVEGVRQLR